MRFILYKLATTPIDSRAHVLNPKLRLARHKPSPSTLSEVLPTWPELDVPRLWADLLSPGDTQPPSGPQSFLEGGTHAPKKAVRTGAIKAGGLTRSEQHIVPVYVVCAVCNAQRKVVVRNERYAVRTAQ